MSFFRDLYIASLFFFFSLGISFFFVLCFFFEGLYFFVQLSLFLFIAACCWDLVYLFSVKNALNIKRIYPDKLSNGDLNEFKIELKSGYPTPVKVRVLEELPLQFQKRDFVSYKKLTKKASELIAYQLRPVARGL